MRSTRTRPPGSAEERKDDRWQRDNRRARSPSGTTSAKVKSHPVMPTKRRISKKSRLFSALGKGPCLSGGEVRNTVQLNGSSYASSQKENKSTKDISLTAPTRLKGESSSLKGGASSAEESNNRSLGITVPLTNSENIVEPAPISSSKESDSDSANDCEVTEARPRYDPKIDSNALKPIIKLEHCVIGPSKTSGIRQVDLPKPDNKNEQLNKSTQEMSDTVPRVSFPQHVQEKLHELAFENKKRVTEEPRRNATSTVVNNNEKNNSSSGSNRLAVQSDKPINSIAFANNYVSEIISKAVAFAKQGRGRKKKRGSRKKLAKNSSNEISPLANSDHFKVQKTEKLAQINENNSVANRNYVDEVLSKAVAFATKKRGRPRKQKVIPTNEKEKSSDERNPSSEFIKLEVMTEELTETNSEENAEVADNGSGSDVVKTEKTCFKNDDENVVNNSLQPNTSEVQTEQKPATETVSNKKEEVVVVADNSCVRDVSLNIETTAAKGNDVVKKRRRRRTYAEMLVAQSPPRSTQSDFEPPQSENTEICDLNTDVADSVKTRIKRTSRYSLRETNQTPNLKKKRRNAKEGKVSVGGGHRESLPSVDEVCVVEGIEMLVFNRLKDMTQYTSLEEKMKAKLCPPQNEDFDVNDDIFNLVDEIPAEEIAALTEAQLELPTEDQNNETDNAPREPENTNSEPDDNKSRTSLQSALEENSAKNDGCQTHSTISSSRKDSSEENVVRKPSSRAKRSSSRPRRSKGNDKDSAAQKINDALKECSEAWEEIETPRQEESTTDSSQQTKARTKNLSKHLSVDLVSVGSDQVESKSKSEFVNAIVVSPLRESKDKGSEVVQSPSPLTSSIQPLNRKYVMEPVVAQYFKPTEWSSYTWGETKKKKSGSPFVPHILSRKSNKNKQSPSTNSSITGVKQLQTASPCLTPNILTSVKVLPPALHPFDQTPVLSTKAATLPLLRTTNKQASSTNTSKPELSPPCLTPHIRASSPPPLRPFNQLPAINLNETKNGEGMLSSAAATPQAPVLTPCSSPVNISNVEENISVSSVKKKKNDNLATKSALPADNLSAFRTIRELECANDERRKSVVTPPLFSSAGSHFPPDAETVSTAKKSAEDPLVEFRNLVQDPSDTFNPLENLDPPDPSEIVIPSSSQDPLSTQDLLSVHTSSNNSLTIDNAPSLTSSVGIMIKVGVGHVLQRAEALNIHRLLDRSTGSLPSTLAEFCASTVFIGGKPPEVASIVFPVSCPRLISSLELRKEHGVKLVATQQPCFRRTCSTNHGGACSSSGGDSSVRQRLLGTVKSGSALKIPVVSPSTSSTSTASRCTQPQSSTSSKDTTPNPPIASSSRTSTAWINPTSAPATPPQPNKPSSSAASKEDTIPTNLPNAPAPPRKSKPPNSAPNTPNSSLATSPESSSQSEESTPPKQSPVSSVETTPKKNADAEKPTPRKRRTTPKRTRKTPPSSPDCDTDPSNSSNKSSPISSSPRSKNKIPDTPIRIVPSIFEVPIRKEEEIETVISDCNVIQETEETKVAVVKNVVVDLISYVERKEFLEDIPLDPDEPSSEPCISNIRRPQMVRGKRSALALELRRLNADLFEVEDDDLIKQDSVCNLPYCRLGCVCASLSGDGSSLQNHCGKTDCMFECLCSWQGKENQSVPITNATLAWMQDQARRNLAKEEQEFKQTVVRSGTDQKLFVVGGERGRREKKVPQRFRDFFHSDSDNRKLSRAKDSVAESPSTSPSSSSTAKSTPSATPSSVKSTASARTAPTLKTGSKTSVKSTKTAEPSQAALERKKTAKSIPSEVHPSAQSSQVWPTIWFKRPDHESGSNKSTSARTESISRKADLNDPADRESSTPFGDNDDLFGNQSENSQSPILKIASVSSLAENVPDSNSIEYREIDELFSSHPKRRIGPDEKVVDLVPCKMLKQRYIDRDIYVWLKPQTAKTKPRVFITRANKPPFDTCLEISQASPDQLSTLRFNITVLLEPSVTDLEKNAFWILHFQKGRWLISGYMRPSGAVGDAADIPKEPDVQDVQNAVIDVGSKEESPVPKRKRWWILRLQEQFDLIYFYRHRLAALKSQLMNVAQITNSPDRRPGTLARWPLLLGSTKKTFPFGIYGIPGLLNHVLVGPYDDCALNQYPGFSVYRKNGDNHRLVPLLLAVKGGHVQLVGNGGSGKVFLEVPTSCAIGHWLRDPNQHGSRDLTLEDMLSCNGSSIISFLKSTRYESPEETTANIRKLKQGLMLFREERANQTVADDDPLAIEVPDEGAKKSTEKKDNDKKKMELDPKDSDISKCTNLMRMLQNDIKPKSNKTSNVRTVTSVGITNTDETKVPAASLYSNPSCSPINIKSLLQSNLAMIPPLERNVEMKKSNSPEPVSYSCETTKQTDEFGLSSSSIKSINSSATCSDQVGLSAVDTSLSAPPAQNKIHWSGLDRMTLCDTDQVNTQRDMANSSPTPEITILDGDAGKLRNSISILKRPASVSQDDVPLKLRKADMNLEMNNELASSQKFKGGEKIYLVPTLFELGYIEITRLRNDALAVNHVIKDELRFYKSRSELLKNIDFQVLKRINTLSGVPIQLVWKFREHLNEFKKMRPLNKELLNGHYVLIKSTFLDMRKLNLQGIDRLPISMEAKMELKKKVERTCKKTFNDPIVFTEKCVSPTPAPSASPENKTESSDFEENLVPAIMSVAPGLSKEALEEAIKRAMKMCRRNSKNGDSSISDPNSKTGVKRTWPTIESQPSEKADLEGENVKKIKTTDTAESHVSHPTLVHHFKKPFSRLNIAVREDGIVDSASPRVSTAKGFVSFLHSNSDPAVIASPMPLGNPTSIGSTSSSSRNASSPLTTAPEMVFPRTIPTALPSSSPGLNVSPVTINSAKSVETHVSSSLQSDSSTPVSNTARSVAKPFFVSSSQLLPSPSTSIPSTSSVYLMEPKPTDKALLSPTVLKLQPSKSGLISCVTNKGKTVILKTISNPSSKGIESKPENAKEQNHASDDKPSSRSSSMVIKLISPSKSVPNTQRTQGVSVKRPGLYPVKPLFPKVKKPLIVTSSFQKIDLPVSKGESARPASPEKSDIGKIFSPVTSNSKQLPE